MKKLLIAAGSAAALAFLAQPTAAQDIETEEDLSEAMAGLSEVFPVEPLTAEQQARLPTARRVVEHFLPEGTMADMMGSMLGGILTPLNESDLGAASALDSALGYVANTGLMDEADILATLEIVDPEWQARNAAEIQAMEEMMVRMATVLEPTMRDVMGELYAIYFTQEQLEDVEIFFQTESGAAFARQSWSMSSDPRIMGAMFSNEAMWEAMFDIEQVEAQMDALPASKSYEDLTPEQRARVLELTGLTDAQLRTGISTSWESVEAMEAMEAVEEAASDAEAPMDSGEQGTK